MNTYHRNHGQFGIGLGLRVNLKLTPHYYYSILLLMWRRATHITYQQNCEKLPHSPIFKHFWISEECVKKTPNRRHHVPPELHKPLPRKLCHRPRKIQVGHCGIKKFRDSKWSCRRTIGRYNMHHFRLWCLFSTTLEKGFRHFAGNLGEIYKTVSTVQPTI